MSKLFSPIAQLGIVRVQSYKNGYYTLVQTQITNQCNDGARGSLGDQCDSQDVTVRSSGIAKLVSRISLFGMVKVQSRSYRVMAHTHGPHQNDASTVASPEDQTEAIRNFAGNNPRGVRQHRIGENVSRKDKISFLVGTLLDLRDSKEAIYGALDAWVAWEQNFPIGPLKNVLLALEKEQQWHRVVQVIKWMLSKGQGNTMGTYGQLIRALDMDHRAEEAHEVWVKKIGNDLHSVPWQLCNLMISVYYRNNKLENLEKLFKGLEAFDRQPPEKSIVQKVVNAYEMLGLLEEREWILEKYKGLFSKTERTKKCRSPKQKKKYCRGKYASS